jgi:hypothetical protein
MADCCWLLESDDMALRTTSESASCCRKRGGRGRVILAFSGEKGAIYEEIRERGFQISMGEREREVSSVAAPVFGLNWHLLGSICISGPTARLTKTKLQAHAKNVIRAANQLSYALAGGKSAQTPAAVSRWHP